MVAMAYCYFPNTIRCINGLYRGVSISPIYLYTVLKNYLVVSWNVDINGKSPFKVLTDTEQRAELIKKGKD